MKLPVFRIQMNWFRMWIQHFRLNTDPDPNAFLIQDFDDQKIFLNIKLENFFFKNLQFTYHQASKKDVQATG